MWMEFQAWYVMILKGRRKLFKHIIDEDLELRLLELYHSQELFELIDGSRNHLKMYLPWVDNTISVSDTKAFIENSKKQYAESNAFDAGIWYKGELAGVIGFHSINRSIKEISIGYWLSEKSLGKGLITRTCKELINFAFNNYKMNRVEIRCAEDNLRSRAIPERLGFTQEGLIRDGELLNEGYVNCVVYGLLKREWCKQ